MLEIKTSELHTRKRAKIDGHIYTVRRMGNLEQLNLSQSMRRLTVLSKIEDNGTKLTDKQALEVEEISSKLANTFVNLFDDGGDQSKSKALLMTLSDLEIKEIMEKIFADGEPVNE